MGCRGTQVLLWVVIVLSLTASGWMRHLGLAGMHLWARWLQPASLALLAAGLVVRIAAMLTLNRWFSANVATRPGQTIERRGLYRIVRHPSHLGLEIVFLAFGLRAHDCFRASYACNDLSHSYRGSSSTRRVRQRVRRVHADDEAADTRVVLRAPRCERAEVKFPHGRGHIA